MASDNHSHNYNYVDCTCPDNPSGRIWYGPHYRTPWIDGVHHVASGGLQNPVTRKESFISDPDDPDEKVDDKILVYYTDFSVPFSDPHRERYARLFNVDKPKAKEIRYFNFGQEMVNDGGSFDRAIYLGRYDFLEKIKYKGDSYYVLIGD